jgi:hypothetical protein
MNFRTTHKRRPEHARHRVRVAAPASTSGRGNDRRPRVPGINEQQATNIRALGVRRPVLVRAAALCGLIAFVTFNVGWIAGDFAQRPGFSPARDDISHLGAMTASSPWLENQVSASLSGLLIVALGVGLWLALSPSRLGRLGAATLVAMGVGAFLDGFFRLDCQPSIDAGCNNDSWHSHAHKIESGFTGGFAFLSILVLALAFRRLPRWRDSWLLSLIAVPAILLASLVFSAIGNGAGQRAADVVAFVWIAFVSVRLLQKGDRPADDPDQREQVG